MSKTNSKKSSTLKYQEAHPIPINSESMTMTNSESPHEWATTISQSEQKAVPIRIVPHPPRQSNEQSQTDKD